MRLSFRAFKEWVDYAGSAEELTEDLAHLGFPCDHLQHRGEGLDQVLVGKVLEKKKHPQADRLNLLKVSTGGEPLSIVCGAQNMKVGDFVALAPVGATVPGKDGEGFTLKRAKIRGEVSEGMCCSEEELLLADESDGIWILPFSEAEGDAQLGKKVAEVLDREDWILHVDITPNRGDAMSVRGLAREIAAKMGTKLKAVPSEKYRESTDHASPSIENFEDAYGFAACLVKGVKYQDSPDEWKSFLEASGSRPISNLVDITNKVLFELGHPIHFFDADKIDPKSIHIRRAKEKEKLKILSGETIELSNEDLVVADKNGALSLAGVMGGEASGVTEETKNILIEVASFNPRRIGATSKRHQLSSESSMRFERGVTPFGIDATMERALNLVRESCGYEMATGSKVATKDYPRKRVLWDRARVEANLGKLGQSDDELFESLGKLGYEFDVKSGVKEVVFPSYRSDVSCLEDVAEDVARLIGYENLEKRPLTAQETVPVLDDLQTELEVGEKVLDQLVARGFTEVLHPSFSNPDLEKSVGFKVDEYIQLKNPIHSEKSVLRTQLVPQLLERAVYNSHYAEDEIRLVELGPVFHKKRDSVYADSPFGEVWSLACCWLQSSNDQKRLWHRNIDPFFDFKGMLERLWDEVKVRRVDLPELSFLHPKRQISFANGFAGELHPAVMKAMDIRGRCFVAEWVINGQLRKRQYSEPWKFPSIDLDASFAMPKDLAVSQLMDKFKSKKEALLEDVQPYDIFESKEIGENRRSVTFKMRYRKADGTLELEEAKAIHQGLVQAVIDGFSDSEITLR